MAPSVPNMTNRTLSGLFWTSLATGANVVSLLLVLIVLARLLTPADFGLAAAALMVVGFSAIFSDFGVGPAIVQRSDLRPAHVGSGFVISLVLGVVLGVLTWLAAPVLADFFHLDELAPILRTLAIIFPVQALGVVADSLLQRELRFRALALLDVITFIAGYGVVGITLAVLGFGAWALIGAHLVQISLRTVLLLCVRPHPVWPLLERRACAELLTFGGGLTAGRISNYFAGQAEHLVIGRWLGPVALGVYGRAYHLMAGPAVLFGNVLDRVLFPTMVQVQDRPKRLAITYRRGVALIALVMLPLSAVVVCLAPEVVHILLGPDWNAVILPLQILGVGMLFRTSSKISDSLVRAIGAVYRRSWRQTAYAILVFVGAWIGQHWGLEGVALAVLVTLALNFVLMAQLALRLTTMPWRMFTNAHLPGFALAALVGLPVAATAALLRAWSVGPLALVVLSTAVLIPCLMAVVCWPRVFLGRNGQWMARKLIDWVRGLRRSSADKTPEIVGEFPATAGQPIVMLNRCLAAVGVRYARWKVRVDLQRVLSGAGDLDLLVDRNHADRFLRVAEELGFKRVVPCFEANLPAEAHLYGLDHETGALLHLHVNFSLLDDRFISPRTVNSAGWEGEAPAELGSTGSAGASPSRRPSRDIRNGRLVEEIQLSPSLEDLLLQDCTLETTAGVLEGMPVVRPRGELMAFVLRTMEQYVRLTELPRLMLTRERLQKKLQTLLAADAEEGWRALLENWLPTEVSAAFCEWLTTLQQPTSWLCRCRSARRLQKQLRGCGQGQPHEAAPAPAANLLKAIWWRLRHGHGTPKQLPSGGLLIAFVGPDASGKSTMVSESARWLGKVFRVEVAHLGKPPSTWLTWLPNVAGRLLGRVAPHMRTFHQRPVQAGTKSGGQGLLYRFRAVLLAWDRRALALRLARKADDGWLVICDRYPTACVGAPDSARLRAPEAEPGRSWLQACLARLENRLYRDIPDPGIVIRLSAPLALTIDRNRERDKPGKEGDDFVARRHGDFFMPSFGAAQVIELDNSISREASVQAVRRQLWADLCWPTQRRTPNHEGAPSLHLMEGSDNGGAAGKPQRSLVVEFIGVTGVGKSTLIAAVVQTLTAQGLRVGLAEDVILARHGIPLTGHPKAQSALVLALSLRPFWRYFFTREGCQLSRLAFNSIARGMSNVWVGANLGRNFVKRIGAHLLLENLRGEGHDYDIVIWDEGAVHAAHNLFVHSAAAPRPEEIEAFASLVPKPDLLIWVTAPTAQSTKVILQRGHSRVEATALAAATFAERAQTTFDVLASVPQLKAKIFQIDNSAQTEKQNEQAIGARAAVIGAFLVQRLQQAEEEQPREGAAFCLIA